MSTHKLKIGVILAPKFTLSALSNFLDVLRLAADEGDRSQRLHCNWEIIGASGNPVMSSAGFSITPDQRLGRPGRFDYITVVGGLLHHSEDLDLTSIKFLKEAADQKIPLIGLCTGALILCKAGLMHGYRCCVSWYHAEDLTMDSEGCIPVTDAPYVIDRDRLTCAGGASTAFLASFLVDRHIGKSAAKKSLQILMFDDGKSKTVPLPDVPVELATDDPLIRRALALFLEDRQGSLKVNEVADRLHVSRRQLERRFRDRVGRPPQKAILAIKVEKAKLYLEQSDVGIIDVAMKLGFCDGSHLTRVFKEFTGETPAAWRANGGPQNSGTDRTLPRDEASITANN